MPATPGGASGVKPMPRTLGGGLITRSRLRTIAASAKTTSIYKQERFSDHAPLIVDYDWSI
jgi:hypothetical protein